MRVCVCEREMRSDYTMCVWGVVAQCVYAKWLYNVCMICVCVRERDMMSHYTMCVWGVNAHCVYMEWLWWERECVREREMGDYTMCLWRVCMCERDMISDYTLCVWGVLTQCNNCVSWVIIWYVYVEWLYNVCLMRVCAREREYTMCVWWVITSCMNGESDCTLCL